jgi:hypothetical protein
MVNNKRPKWTHHVFGVLVNPSTGPAKDTYNVLKTKKISTTGPDGF